MADLRSVLFNRGPVWFAVDGTALTIVPSDHTADEWMSVFAGGDLMLLLTFLDSSNRERLMDAVAAGSLLPDRVKRAQYAIITNATGRPWWEALRLAATVTGSDGRIMGSLVLAGVRAESMPIADYLCAVWAFLTRNADEKDLLKLESQLKMPPPDAEDEDYDMYEDDFAGTVQQLQNMPGVSLG